MGKKKGKKGKTQDSAAAPSGSQEQGPQGSSRQQPSSGQPEQEGARGSQQKIEQHQTKPTREASLTHQYGASVGRETQGSPQIGAQQPKQDLRQIRPQQQQQTGSRRQEQISQQTASVGRQQPSQYVGPPHQIGSGGQLPSGPPTQPSEPPLGIPHQPPPGIPAVQQGPWGRPAQPSQTPQPPQSIPQQPPLGIPAVQQGPWRRPAQPSQTPQPPQSIPQQPPPGIPAVQQGPWVRPAQPSQTPQGIHQQPPQGISQQPQRFSQSKQTPVQQPKGQKGKQQVSKQREGAKQGASSSQEPPTTSLSKVHIGKTETGGGDAQLLPLEYIKAVPGIKGTKIKVETNHLSLNLGTLKTAVHYDVNLVPDRPKKFLRYVVEKFRKKHFNNRYPAFDGRKNLYSASLLPFDNYIEDEISIHLADDTPKTYKVEIKFANYVDLTPLHDLLKSKETPREALQVVDIVLRSAPASTCITAGRSFFTKPSQFIDLGEGMEMYTGFYQSAIRGWKPFLNVDVAHKAFPKGIKVDQLMEQLFRGRPSRAQTDMLSAFITTLRVCYEIPRQASTRRMYTVNGVSTSPRQTTFKLGNEVITIENYYKVHKNYILKYPELPTLWVGSKSRADKILLPLELCTVVEGQVTNRKLTENQTRYMIQETAQDAKIRKDKIMASLDQAKHNDHPSVKNEFKFSVGKEFTKVDARILDPPVLTYANQNVRPSKGVWKNSLFIDTMSMNKWTIACVDRYNAKPGDLTNLAEMLRSSARSTGMTINPPEKPFIHIRSQTLADIQSYFRSQKSKEYDVIFVIVPNSGPQYSYVKTAAEINVGCLTQCIKSNTISRMREATALNLLLKVNSKLNGLNHCLGNRPDIMQKPFMIMGADVTHPSPDARNIPSVAAVTASHDPKAFKYNICWRLQQPKVEIIEDLETIVVEQLKFFYKQTNGRKPETIIFFRDGVSEGQFVQVRNAEIRAIRAACKKIQRTDYEPKITFLVVQKRHHTRLFPLDRKYEDKNFNVPPGTCVDSHITHPFMQDFYLVSHASIKGVARPTKYCTLWDDNSLTNDQIEELTYYLCHMFTRCNRSVSYPAPTYYAHLAAARGKVYIENEQIDMNKLQEKFSKLQILKEIKEERPMFFV